MDIIEFYKLKEDIIGSLVAFNDSTPLFGSKYSGIGIILDARFIDDNVFVKVFWIKSPYINFIDERKIGWQIFKRLIILQNPKGERNICL